MSTVPHLMQAVVAEAVNEPLSLVQVSTPQPGAGEVLVRVMASALNPLDLKIRAGVASHARHPLPAILGIDMAGVVAAVGTNDPTFTVGDEVFGMAGGVGGRPGSLAEYIAVDARLLARKPANFSMREAAAVPLAFITAWEGLIDRAALRRGQRVLVRGAGGVGKMALQIARAHGAVTYAAGSKSSRQTIEGLGAKFVDKEELPTEVVARETSNQGFDVVFDTAGGASLDTAFTMVRRFGHVVSALGWGTHSLAPLSFKAASYSGIFTLLPLLSGEGTTHHGEILAEATKLGEAGALVPELHSGHFTLSTVGDAYRLLESGTARGKLVVDIGEESAS